MQREKGETGACVPTKLEEGSADQPVLSGSIWIGIRHEPRLGLTEPGIVRKDKLRTNSESGGEERERKRKVERHA